MSLSKNMYMVRKAVVMAIVDTLEGLSDCERILMTIAVYDPKSKDSSPLWDAPLNKVNNGFITLNVSQTSTGYRLFNNEFLHLSTRFDGRDTELFIPYSLIVSVAGLDSADQPIAFENLVPFGFIPSAQKDAPLPQPVSEGNVVPVTFGKKH